MTQEEIIKNNKLIAEFMGLQENKSFIEIDNERKQIGAFVGSPMYDINGVISNLRYDFSWDWLFPVIKKCRETASKYDDYSIEKSNYNNIQFNLLTLSIENVYPNVIKFIEWDNSLKF